jgi:hypothetical protein
MSSAAWKAIRPFSTSAAPRLSAAAGPPFACRMTSISGPRPERCSATATSAVASVEPSSTTMMRFGGSVWSQTLRTASAR